MFDGPVARLAPGIHALSLPETTSFAANVLRVLCCSPLILSLLNLCDINWFRNHFLLHLLIVYILLIPTLFLVSDHHPPYIATVRHCSSISLAQSPTLNPSIRSLRHHD